MERLPPSPGFAVAGLVTHASSAFSSENYERGLDALESTAEQNGIRYLGCFGCQGRLDPAVQPIAQQQRRVTDEDWAQRMADADTHPDATDEARARTFASQVVVSIRRGC